ncbi:MAG: hypothetical protein ABIK09_12905 [Pseudomonadota bacterium]
MKRSRSRLFGLLVLAVLPLLRRGRGLRGRGLCARRLDALVTAALLEALDDLPMPLDATAITVLGAGGRLTLERSRT